MSHPAIQRCGCQSGCQSGLGHLGEDGVDERGLDAIADRYYGGLKRNQMEQRIELVSRP